MLMMKTVFRLRYGSEPEKGIANKLPEMGASYADEQSEEGDQVSSIGGINSQCCAAYIAIAPVDPAACIYLTYYRIRRHWRYGCWKMCNVIQSAIISLR